jgi:arginyl-tRNA synthetase
MKTFWFAIKSQIAERLSHIVSYPVSPDEFVAPPKPEQGDLAYGCFTLAKRMGKAPAEIAQMIATQFGKNNHTVEHIVAEGPFVNITLHAGEFMHRFVREVELQGAAFGQNDVGEGKEMMLEYAQPNTHKEMHVGHLRNLVLGASLVNILKHARWKLITASYHGDVGAHVAKCLWRMVYHSSPNPSLAGRGELTDEEVQMLLEKIPTEHRTGAYLGQLYTEATKQLEEHPEVQTEVSRVQQLLEARDPAWTKLWIETRRWSLVEMIATFEELGVSIDRQYLESEVMEEGQKIVDTLLADEVAVVSEGAVIVNLEDQKLGAFLIRKSDGTSLYATKDLALAYLKQREYPHLTRSVMLVDDRQSLYFKQLFATLKLMGYAVPLEHVGYEFVTLKSGAMSSREGNIVTYQSFRDEVVKRAREMTMERHADWSEGKVQYTAWVIAQSAIKFGMLRQDADKIFTFDLEQALAFDGQTGPYVQYALVRLHSILRKANAPHVRGTDEPDCRVLTEPREKALAMTLTRFVDVSRRAAAELRPNLVAQWCVEAAQECNAFYRDVAVLDAPEPIRSARLRLVYAARDVLTQGLTLLGIPVPEEM